jgi:hypothetical protein
MKFMIRRNTELNNYMSCKSGERRLQVTHVKETFRHLNTVSERIVMREEKQ